MPSQSKSSGAAALGRPRERFNREDNVTAAAISVMSEKGYASTSIQEVAERVGVLKGSLYHYFSSKEELLYNILQESHEQTQAIYTEVADEQLPAEEHLLRYLERFCAWTLENVDRANIFFTETRHLTGDRLETANGWGRTFERAVSDLVVQAQADGAIRSDLDQRMITRFLIGAVNNVRFWPTRKAGRKFSNDEIVGAIISMIESAIAHP